MAWKAPDVLGGFQEAANDAADAVADAVLPSTPVAFRREAQALAARRAQINASINRYCTAASEDFDSQACGLAHDEKDQYFADLEEFRERVRQANIEQDGLFWRFIFGGLGDVDPYEGDPTQGSNQAWWRYLLNFET
jgi:hypothetical protein